MGSNKYAFQLKYKSHDYILTMNILTIFIIKEWGWTLTITWIEYIGIVSILRTCIPHMVNILFMKLIIINWCTCNCANEFFNILSAGPKKDDQAIRMKPSTIHVNHFNTPYSNGEHFVNKIIILDVHVTVLMNSSISYQELVKDPRKLIQQ